MERSVAHFSTQLQCCALFHLCRCNRIKTLPFYKMNRYSNGVYVFHFFFCKFTSKMSANNDGSLEAFNVCANC